MKKQPADKERFLVNLIKNGFETTRVDEFILAQPDWEYLLGSSVREGVFYPFYLNLLAIDPKGRLIPEEFRDRFQQVYYLHLSKSAEFSDNIDRLLNFIDSLNIEVLSFKGAAIDALIYDGYFRPRLDVDIVVKDNDVSTLKNVIATPEYDRSMPLHIHRHLINNTFLTMDSALRMDMEKVWDNTEPFKAYRNISTLKPELNILYLAEHALKHDFDQLVFLYEIERLINFYKERLDWNKFIELACEFGMTRIVYYGLYFVKEILSGDVPDRVMDSLRPKRFTLGEKRFIEDTLHNRCNRYSSYAVYLAARVGLLKKTNFLFRTAFPAGANLKDNLARLRRLVLR